MSVRSAFEVRKSPSSTQPTKGSPFASKRKPLAEIPNRNVHAITDDEPTERMHVSAPKPKYQGQQFVPTDEPWFQDEPQSSAGGTADQISWPFF
jgi:hypothetical protein